VVADGGRDSFREWTRRRLSAALGRPLALTTREGMIHRWTVTRDGHEPVVVTLNSPELAEMAHVLVSDPESVRSEPVRSMCLRTEEDVHRVMEQIKALRFVSARVEAARDEAERHARHGSRERRVEPGDQE
jgi:hypothetical protein